MIKLDVCGQRQGRSKMTMLDIYQELLQVTRAFDRHNIDYALCEGMALAVYDVIQATVDRDLLKLKDTKNRAGT